MMLAGWHRRATYPLGIPPPDWGVRPLLELLARSSCS
jgi:hypothetical protein